MEDFQRLQTRSALCAQRLELGEEGFAGKLLAEQHQLQRAALPIGANCEVRGEDGLVDGRAERVLGVEDVVGRHVQAFGATVELVEKPAYLGKEVLRAVGRLAIAQQEQHEEAVVQQIEQRARVARGVARIGKGGGRAGRGVAKQRGHRSGAHEVTAISSS